MNNTLVHVKNTKKMGRGIFAFKPIKKGTVISTEEILVFSEDQTREINNTCLQTYTFRYDDTRDCLVLGNGEIYNHSHVPNVSYKIVKKNGRHMMRFRAVRPIKKGEQLVIDYLADIGEFQLNTLSVYLTAPSLYE